MNLSPLIFIPLLGALFVTLAPVRSPRRLAVVWSLLPLLCTIFLWLSGKMPISERHVWIPALGIEYHLGLDGIGLLFVALTGLVTPFALGVSSMVKENERAFLALILVMQAMLFGAFTALNFVLWFLFWELSLIPAFLLVRLWGGPERNKAALQFFLMTMAGSLAMLAGFLALNLGTGSFDFTELASRSDGIAGQLAARFPAMGGSMIWIVFGGVLLGLSVKVPLMPLHTWLPSAYQQAPTPVSMLLTGLLSKLGVYGFLRILLPIFPQQIQAILTPLLWITVATIVFSAMAAMAQTDLKRIVAYSSVNHLGYCMLGIFAVAGSFGPGAKAPDQAAALGGVLLQVFNHGVIASALFCFIGFIEVRSGGHRNLADFGGIRQKAPVLAGLMGIALFASLGLPGLSGFVGEFLIFKGVFALAPQAAAVATIGLLFTALFALRIQRRVFHGPLAQNCSAMLDLGVRERLAVAPFIALIFLLGVWPQPLLDLFNADVTRLLGQLNF